MSQETTAEGRPELPPALKGLGERLVKSIRASSRLKLDRLLGEDGAIREEEIEDEFPPLVPGHHLALVLLAGPEVRIVGKVFYDTKQLKGIVGEALKSEKFGGTPSAFVREYLRQLSFLWGGSYRSHGVSVHSTEPVAVKGFNEVFYPAAQFPKLGEGRWRLARGNFSVWCTISIEVVDPKVLKKLRQMPEDLFGLEPLAQAIYELPQAQTLPSL